MSSVVTQPEAVGPESAPAGGPAHARGLGADVDLAGAGVLAAALVAIAFVTKASFAGTNLGANTWTQIAIVLVGAAAFGAVALGGAAGRFRGVPALALFVALAGLTYASIGWSVQPSDSWLEANRTLSYLAAFGAALAFARIAPKRWPALVGAVAIASVALTAWALLAKVFPGSLDAADTLGRLNAPFGYWNAVGLIAALGLAPVLWAGARPQAPRLLRTLAVPAITVLITALVLSYGRGALAAAVIGVGLWLALVPFRLRAVLLLAPGAAGAAVAIAWAVGSHALSHDNIALSARTSAGHSFGAVMLVALAVTTAAGYGAAVFGDRITLSAAVRRRAQVGLVVLAALIPAGGIVALAASSRGFSGEVSHLWTELTNPKAAVGATANRLVQLGSSRPVYWHEGFEVGAHHLLVGAGAGGFAVASRRYAQNLWGVAAQAHSYVVQTFADLGLVGLAVSLALLAAWALAAARTLGVRGARAGPEYIEERIGLLTMLAIVVIFGVHSAIDWSWFIPGVALPALICAGWLVGRGPLAHPVGRLPRIRRVGDAPGRFAAVTVAAALALGCAWVIWQPLRATNAYNAAIAAGSTGNTRAAFADARAAAGEDPVSIQPLFELSTLYMQIGDPVRARLELLRALSMQPQNADAWTQLGEFDLDLVHHPRVALPELLHAHLLDPGGTSILNDVMAARVAAGR